LLWQIAYAEFYFTDVLWPDFKKKIYMKQLLVIKKENEDLEKQVNKLNKKILVLNKLHKN
jgi:undecaprenyl diphosphate synthase